MLSCLRGRSAQAIESNADALAAADVAVNVEAARLLAYQAAWLVDAGRPNTQQVETCIRLLQSAFARCPVVQASMAKLLASEAAKAAVSACSAGASWLPKCRS